MSYMVARMQKMKAVNLGGAYRHNERIFENHSNKDIDTSRSHLNYELTDRDRELSYKSQIEDYINENKVSERAIRKDAVLCDEWIITSDKTFFEKLDQEKTRDFFETAKNYFAENYGEENIAYASVHLDESTPHMHMGVVPFENGKLSSKAMFDREELKKIQDELPKYMNEHGFDLQRGELNSEAKHKTVAEFKKDLATTELQQELDRLNEVLKEKYEELDKIELRASESLSELDKYKNDINALEDTKRALETEIGDYKDELRDSRTLKQKDEEWRKEFTGKVKKNPITGNESVVLDKKVYDDARWSFVRQENRLLKKDEEIRQLGTQMKSLVSSNREKANRLDEIKAELKELRTENNWLRTENKGLIERLDLMTRKLNIWRKKAKEHLPTAEFKGLSKKLNEVQPLKEIIKPLKVLTKVKDVIEKSLF
jgi:regulator of replication initiation timing